MIVKGTNPHATALQMEYDLDTDIAWYVLSSGRRAKSLCSVTEWLLVFKAAGIPFPVDPDVLMDTGL